jgi:hypothetical protein
MATRKSKGPERREDLIVQKLGDEVIVYDRLSHRAHSLNKPAALVFEKLDGKHDLASIGRHVGQSLGKSRQDDIVTSAVNELAAADLLRPGASLPRRAALRGLAASIIPVVVSIAVPAAAAAESCVAEFGPCYGPFSSECCPGLDCVDQGSGYQCTDLGSGQTQ